MVYWNISCFCSFLLVIYICCLYRALANSLLPKEILTSKRVKFSLLIFKKETDDKFVGNYSFSFY
jgi:hypothetical protein